MDDSSMGLNEFNDLSISDSSESLSLLLLSVSELLQNPFLLPRFFILHPCGELFILHSLMYFQTFFSVFAFPNWSIFLTWSMFTYDSIELHLIPKKMLGSQNNNSDQLSI